MKFQTCFRRIVPCLILALSTMAWAQIFVPTGGPIEIQYNDAGLWNWRPPSQGFLIQFGAQRDMSYPGNPWQQFSVRFKDNCNGVDYWYQGNESFGAHNWQTIVPPTAMNLNPGNVGAFTKWTAFPLEITKTETWEVKGQIVKIEFTATNIGCCDLEEVFFMHAVDSDQDRQLPAPAGTYNTINDTISALAPFDLVYSEGPSSGWTTAYGECHRSQRLGHTDWQTDPYTALIDYNGLNVDDTMHATQPYGVISPGETVRFAFLFIVGRDRGQAVDLYRENRDRLCDCERESPYPYEPLDPGHFKPVPLDGSHLLTYATKRGNGTLLDAVIEQAIDAKRPYFPALSAEALSDAHIFNAEPVESWEEAVRYYNPDPTKIPPAYGGKDR